MTIRNLYIFQAVYQTESFTRAADQLFLTQSGISHAIRELEEEAGTQLFERVGRKIRPTAGARLLYQESAALLEQFGQLEMRLSRLEEEAPLRIASSITVASFYLARAQRLLRSHHPLLRMETSVCTAAGAVQLLREGQADLCLAEGICPQGPFIAQIFAQSKIAAVCAPDYPAPENMNAAQLVRHKLLVREKGSALRDILDSALLLKGLGISPVWTSVNSGALQFASQEGLGVALLPDQLVEEDIRCGKLREIVLTDLELYNPMFSLRHREKRQTAASEELQGILRELALEKGRLFPGK